MIPDVSSGESTIILVIMVLTWIVLAATIITVILDAIDRLRDRLRR